MYQSVCQRRNFTMLSMRSNIFREKKFFSPIFEFSKSCQLNFSGYYINWIIWLNFVYLGSTMYWLHFGTSMHFFLEYWALYYEKKIITTTSRCYVKKKKKIPFTGPKYQNLGFLMRGYNYQSIKTNNHKGLFSYLQLKLEKLIFSYFF